MKRFLLIASLYVFAVQLQAQTSTNEPIKTKYDPHVLFNPIFYTQHGNEYRTATGEPGQAYWQNRVDYVIKATLNDSLKKITASVTITYKNNSPQNLPFVWLQLDQNLYANNSRGSAKLPVGGRSRYGDAGSNFIGGYNIENVKIINGTTESNANFLVTDTRMQIRFANAVAAKNGMVKFKIDYSYFIPAQGSDRTGILPTKNGDIFAIAQWFPRMCVFDDVQGWNTLPYLGASEFYCEYGDFDVQITAPASHIVVASGDLLNAAEVLTAAQLQRYNNAKKSDATVVIRSATEVTEATSRPNKPTLTWKYKMQNSRDFAWASSKSFIWDAAKINFTDGTTAMAQSVYPVESDGKNGYSRSTEYTKASIENYSKRWFKYPYPCAVNVATNISGMEYPGIVFCGWKSQNAGLFGVTDHEFGHTWFPMIVGSNERKYGWMDEGFNTFINGLAAEDFNNGEYKEKPLDWHQYAKFVFGATSESIMNTPDAMLERNIGICLYLKPGYGLQLLREHITDTARFDFAFRRYINDWKYKHPTPFDFFRSIENGVGEDLSWFWRSFFIENYKLDQAVTKLEYVAKDSSKGAIVTIENLEQMAMPVVIEITTASGKKERKKLPVEIWQSTASWKIKFNTTEAISTVIIDPDHVFPDVNSSNNTLKLN
jgi:hypothetical protein